MGLIDRTQKGVLKDLIIAGDDNLQSALDRFEEGDPSFLESMIKSGKLQSNCSGDIDVLGDLDLDFLTVDDDDFGRLGSGVVEKPESTMSHHPGMSLAHAQSMPMQIVSGGGQQHQSLPSSQVVVQSSSAGYVDDDIGDLDFNDEYDEAATEEDLHLPAGAYMSQGGSASVEAQQRQGQGQHHQQLGLCGLSAGEGRFRANSLAYGALLDEPLPQRSYGNWMDRPPTASSQHLAAIDPNGIRGNSVAMGMGTETVGANRITYVLHDSNSGQSPRPQASAPSSSAPAERNRNDSKMTAIATNRLEQAAERRREKQERREQRDQEKRAAAAARVAAAQVKRERKERDMQEKRERREAQRRERERNKKEKEKRGSSILERECGVSGGDDMSDDEQKEIVSGTGRPRSLSDPNLNVGLDNDGLMQIDNPEGWVGAYSPDSRKMRIERFLEKRNHRVWTKKVKYDVRKNFADSRLRVKGRFVKKEDELLMRDLMSLT